MTNIEKYTIFLIEQYRFKFGISANSAYNLFKNKGILDYINSTFEAIHTLDTNFVLAEIEELVKYPYATSPHNPYAQ